MLIFNPIKYLNKNDTLQIYLIEQIFNKTIYKNISKHKQKMGQKMKQPEGVQKNFNGPMKKSPNPKEKAA